MEAVRGWVWIFSGIAHFNPVNSIKSSFYSVFTDVLLGNIHMSKS